MTSMVRSPGSSRKHPRYTAPGIIDGAGVLIPGDGAGVSGMADGARVLGVADGPGVLSSELL